MYRSNCGRSSIRDGRCVNTSTTRSNIDNIESNPQGWITVVQSCTEHRLRPSKKLQRVQNSLALLVLQVTTTENVTRPVLRSLHWLPVSQRIEFKVAALTYKIRSTSRPAYLHSLLSNHISESTATLRSASRPLLHIMNSNCLRHSRLLCRCTNFMEQSTC